MSNNIENFFNHEASQSASDRELRRWCIEQVDASTQAEYAIIQAALIYDWVCGKPKADAA